ncbi:MAG: NUDIX domain-containing protein, partial [Bdellovibrionales bacterium]|nr:NUDIX domain-containing protein [Bdellovibrionales bacterium]
SQLPVMICPYWTQTLTSPVDLATVLDSLTDSALKLEYTRKVFDLAGCQALTYLEMMRETARKIGKHRLFIKIPLFTPTLSRLWVRLITGSSKNLIYPLVESLKHEMVARKEHLYPNMNIDRSYYDLLDSVTLRTNKTRKALAYKLHCKTVRSVQRFPLPRGKDASWTTDKYINWLPWLLAPFIKINIDLEKVEFSLLFKKWVLIGFLKSPQRSDPTRQLLYITNGLLVHQKNRGRLEFREVLDRKYIIAAVHDYRPSLPWFIYLFVQAKIHLWVMSSFSSYVGKYEKTHKNITNENSRAMTLKSTIGSGALVIQDNSVLLVQLNYGHLKGQWILPGGLLEPGENPEQAAKRELKEETNQVGEIVVLHSVRFRKDPADVYWVFRIRLESQRPIEFPREELQCVRFWSIEEALSSKEVRPMTKYFVSSALSSQPSDIELPKQHADTDLVYFFV